MTTEDNRFHYRGEYWVRETAFADMARENAELRRERDAARKGLEICWDAKDMPSDDEIQEIEAIVAAHRVLAAAQHAAKGG